MSFSGFSEDDIRKINNCDSRALQKAPTKKVTFKANIVKTNATKNVKNNNIVAVTTAEILPEEAKLDTKSATKEPVIIQPETTEPPPLPQEKRIKDLTDFETRQKLIEEQNRKRKELLAKALADRTKRTQEEAERLKEIQQEFKKLDAILSNDVKILRKQIEAASVDYHECQKKYNKIEKEFLEAKLLLHQKLEKKEMLTEHLCAIIEKNEERKGEKLDELLQKLQINPEESARNEDNLKERAVEEINN